MKHFAWIEWTGMPTTVADQVLRIVERYGQTDQLRAMLEESTVQHASQGDANVADATQG